MAASGFAKELQAIQKMLDVLEPLDEPARLFAFKTVSERLNIAIPAGNQSQKGAGAGGQLLAASVTLGGQAGVQEEKKFVSAKKAQKDTELVTCIAYVLKNRGVHVFKTEELTKAATELATRALTNMSATARDAVNAGYLAKAGGGRKQISPLGEAVVDALPDRTAVANAIAEMKPRRRARKKAAKK